jgi:NADH dehydrogenase
MGGRDDESAEGRDLVTERQGRILVTGANGHVGIRLIRRLADRGSASPEVRALVRSERAANTLRELPESCRPDLRIVDYADAEAVAAAAGGCDRIVHLIGILKETKSARYLDAHEAASSALAHAAEKVGAQRIVYMSILGAGPEVDNACLASKGRAERILLDCRVPVTVLRVPMVLGPGEIAAFALRSQLRAFLVPLVRGGAALEQPVDSEDVVTAIEKALAEEGGDDAVLDLAGPESLTHRELVCRAARLIAKKPRFLPVPMAAATLFAWLAERFADNPPLTPAMLGVLERDDRIDPSPCCERLGLKLTPLDETLRRCLGEEGSSW